MGARDTDVDKRCRVRERDENSPTRIGEGGASRPGDGGRVRCIGDEQPDDRKMVVATRREAVEVIMRFHQRRNLLLQRGDKRASPNRREQILRRRCLSPLPRRLLTVPFSLFFLFNLLPPQKPMLNKPQRSPSHRPLVILQNHHIAHSQLSQTNAPPPIPLQYPIDHIPLPQFHRPCRSTTIFNLPPNAPPDLPQPFNVVRDIPPIILLDGLDDRAVTRQVRRRHTREIRGLEPGEHERDQALRREAGEGADQGAGCGGDYQRRGEGGEGWGEEFGHLEVWLLVLVCFSCKEVWTIGICGVDEPVLICLVLVRAKLVQIGIASDNGFNNSIAERQRS